MTNIYNKTSTNTLLDAKDAILSFSSPLTRTGNTITFTESAITTLTSFYNKNDADNRYLKLSGGTMTGDLNIKDTTSVDSSLFTRMLNIIGNQARIVLWSSSTSLSSGIELVSGTTTASPTRYSSWNINTGNSSTGDYFNIRQRVDVTNINRIIIGSDGNVGIGTTTNASYKLNVEGAFNATTIWQNGTQLNTLLNAKQNTLTAATTLLGVGSSISALDYNKITLNVPPTFPPTMTNIYSKTESDARYLQLSGGTLSGALTLSSTMSGGTNVSKRHFFTFTPSRVYLGTLGYRYVYDINLTNYITAIGNNHRVFRIHIWSTLGNFEETYAEVMSYYIHISEYNGSYAAKIRSLFNYSNQSIISDTAYNTIYYSGNDGPGGSSEKYCVIENISSH